MATTAVITQWGNAISVHPNYSTKTQGQSPREYWCFSINVERYRYKNAGPLIRYNAEIVAKRIELSDNATPTNVEEIIIFRSYRRGPEMADVAHTLLQSLLQAIDNGDPVWDVREFLSVHTDTGIYITLPSKST